MEELLQILLEEAEAEQRSHWYESGYDIQEEALYALVKVIHRAQARLREGK